MMHQNDTHNDLEVDRNAAIYLIAAIEEAVGLLRAGMDDECFGGGKEQTVAQETLAHLERTLLWAERRAGEPDPRLILDSTQHS